MRTCLPLTLALSVLIGLSSCKKEVVNGDTNENIGNSKIAPDGFNYATTKTVSINIRLLTNNDEPVSGAVASIYSPQHLNNGDELLKVASDKEGYLKGTINIPAYLDELIVSPNYVGLISKAKVSIVNNAVSGVIGGKTGYSGNVVAYATANKKLTSSGFTTKVDSYEYMGTFDGSGRPDSYREPVQDVISASLLQYINNSLPEFQDVRVHHPTYLSEAAPATIDVTKKSDIYITFVTEGADYLNAIGYYTYPTGNPPKSLAAISKIYYMFPNASLPGSGGYLNQGDKIKLGNFQPGTSIAFVLFSNGWTGSGVNPNVTQYHSDAVFNPEVSQNLNRHTVVLKDTKDNLVLIGFEDNNRESPTCDQDFNDIVLYATSSVPDAISQDDLPSLENGVDTDGDGVSDGSDEFPNDPARAYTSYFPSKNNWGTLVYEDLWPKTGDYDLNDMVVGYRYKFVRSASNNVVDLVGEYSLLASGATYKNGFGVELPFSSGVVSSVTGQKLISSYISLAGNGVEAGQSNAVIIPFDNQSALLNGNGSSPYINTVNGQPYVHSDTIQVKLTFTSPQPASILGSAPFNPFLISNLRRGYEVHLPGFAPTAKAQTSLFGTEQDNSNPGSGRYYVTANNRPWAISFVEPFQYPAESNNIADAYLHFLDWAQSGGQLFTDWYKGTGAGYRNSGLIYSK
ncbi:LruC domain-containing protein (plasmid) [Pedobacter sp. BS3]|uniref:LruC domain-containing protein n=1 Tax=Pedobacter sp. BS3 TaxID=2567937 RepID=UPI0011EFE121|nr:LruC domain-containing protein [Pedobacter sp. BS3]TZF86054.1 LruC domain-containing protein [Pedobacter sp. BS3]